MSPRRRKKKMPTKVERLQRRVAALEWALVQAREAGIALEAELIRLAGGLKPRLRYELDFTNRKVGQEPPPHTDADRPVDELADPNALDDDEFEKLWNERPPPPEVPPDETVTYPRREGSHA